MWIAQRRRAPREGLLFLNIYLHPVGKGKARCPISEGHTPTVTMGMTSIPPKLGPELCVTRDTDTYLPSLFHPGISGHLISNP